MGTMKFINKYGLIKSTSADIVGENTALCSMQFAFLWRGSDVAHDMEERVYLFIADHCIDEKGIFTNLPKEDMNNPNTNPKDLAISPDQLIAYAACSKLFAKAIWNNMNFFRYDGRFMQPMAYAFVAYRATGKWWYRLALEIACKVSVNKYIETGKTSGALKAYTCYRACGWNPMDLMVGWSTPFRIYYAEKDHPNHTGELK
jgi:hypothetical protein